MADVQIRPANDEDVEAVYEVVAASQAAAFGTPELTLEQLRNMWEFIPGNWVAVGDGGAVLGTAGLRGNGVDVFVHPRARRKGIGSRLLLTAEGAGDRGVIWAVGPVLEPAAAPFLRRHGYEKAWDFWLMELELDDEPDAPSWPDGVRVRAFGAEDGPAVKELLDEAYAEEPHHEPVPFEEWRQMMTGDPSFDPDLWFLAVGGDEIVGAALNWKEGYVKDIVVHPSHRRRGLGEALMRHTFREFHRRGVPKVGLKTDSINPTEAWRLYERLGMRYARTYEVFEKRL